MSEILCCKCNQKMERNPDGDFPLQKNPHLIVRGYVCPDCGATDEVLSVTVEAPMNDVVNRLEKAMGDIEKKGDVSFGRIPGSVAEWDMGE